MARAELEGSTLLHIDLMVSFLCPCFFISLQIALGIRLKSVSDGWKKLRIFMGFSIFWLKYLRA